MTAPPGILLSDRYQLTERIAVGGMGEVWRACDLALGRAVAVKLLRCGCGGSERDRARFRAEARHAGSLSHPGIARVYDYRDADPPYLVMEMHPAKPTGPPPHASRGRHGRQRHQSPGQAGKHKPSGTPAPTATPQPTGKPSSVLSQGLDQL